MEEASRGMTSDSAVATTTTEFCVSPEIKSLQPSLRQQESSPIQRDIYKYNEEGITDNNDGNSPSSRTSKKFRPSEFNLGGPQMTNTVLDMADNGSCNLMLSGSLMAACQALNTTEGPSMDRSEEGKVVRHKLFEKELTPSDVGRLNRFVVPKKHALDFFPDIKENTDKNVSLEFFDKEKKRWEFGYCFWRSSQSFVLARGWSRFVQEKGLAEKDLVVFYWCEEEQDGRMKQYYMIDVVPCDKDGGKVSLSEHDDGQNENQRSEYSFGKTEQSMKEVEEAVGKVADKVRDKMSSSRSQEEMKLKESSSEDKEDVGVTGQKQERFKKGVRLFGVRIS